MSDSAYDPRPGAAETLRPGLRRLLAPNPSPMTFRGTNTYLIGTGGIAVIDPGPDDPAHLAAIRAALAPGQHVSHILVTHAHRDHAPLAPRLAALTGAPVLAYGLPEAGRSALMRRLAAEGVVGGGEGVDAGFRPDATLADGAVLNGDGWQLEALWTPGHMAHHLCFAWQDAIFTGDLVMGWASTLISPPDGDLGDFLASCTRLARRPERLYLPGHGAPVADGPARAAALTAHRRQRHAQLRAALGEAPQSLAALTARVYDDVDPALLPAAARNLLAHLALLWESGEIVADPHLAADAAFRRADGGAAGKNGKKPLDAP